MRRLIVGVGLGLAILVGSVGGYPRHVAAAKDNVLYNCAAAGPFGAAASAELTEEDAKAFKAYYKSQGGTVKCQKQ